MINFLEPKLLPKITRKPPCTENYEAENLISDVYLDKLRGFIAYPSIKPPVEFEFEFLCNVNICYMFLNTSVGNQRCSGIELFAKNSNTEYVSIGRAVYDAQELTFCNNRKYSKSNPPPCHNTDNALYFFKNGTFKSFLNASNVKIVIFRTEKSVPCLASIEIWGIPAKSCSAKTVDTINRLTNQNVEAASTNRCAENVELSSSIDAIDGKCLFKIPDEFKDELTYELMTIPYTLPSGKTIDHTTLEKHIEGEKSFGRRPGDPFTGIKFREGLKPVLNVGLKSRIDMFLLENSHRTETFQLKRSLRIENNSNKKFKKGNLLTKTNLKSSSFDSGLVDPASNCLNLKSKNDDLDVLIQKAKSNSNFVSFTHSSDTVRNTCILCKSTSEYLYELPCEHCYCRKCLLDTCNKNCICVECTQRFAKSDVQKIDK